VVLVVVSRMFCCTTGYIVCVAGVYLSCEHSDLVSTDQLSAGELSTSVRSASCPSIPIRGCVGTYCTSYGPPKKDFPEQMAVDLHARHDKAVSAGGDLVHTVGSSHVGKH
jgi:hypothetical protein